MSRSRFPGSARASPAEIPGMLREPCGPDAPLPPGQPDAAAAFDRCAGILIRSIANTIYGDAPFKTWGDEAFDPAKRHDGRDWPSIAHFSAQAEISPT